MMMLTEGRLKFDSHANSPIHKLPHCVRPKTGPCSRAVGRDRHGVVAATPLSAPSPPPRALPRHPPVTAWERQLSLPQDPARPATGQRAPTPARPAAGLLGI